LPSTHPPALSHARAGIAVAVPKIAHPGGETAAWWFRDGAAQAAARGAMPAGRRT
jgi:alkaline phosphatase